MKQENEVKIWEAPVTIPTYRPYPAEKVPIFLEKRAYQGSTGKVYPLPVTEKISDTKEDVTYHAVYLENEYIKIMVLPELGGRIQRAYDKTNGYDFVYYNHVIKPALVGLTGPWISGGIEFNWPQHHRPSTYSPVDHTIRRNADGSCSVLLSEIDKMYGTKGMAIITLYPGKAYIEIKGQLYNHTDVPQTFLWWANPAVAVNDSTYSVFPPDVNAVMDHGKRAVSTFPIATGEYYKCDYSAGVDISRYKNIPVPTSYMAAKSEYNFIGNYDESKEAGLLHIADHHVSPGKKQWTWGNGDFGRCWDRNLTDSDGPYIELMTGVYTDNQPDFSWLNPQEEKTFVQYFMPYKGVGRVSNATKDAMLHLSEDGKGHAVLKIYTTSVYRDARIQIEREGTILFDATVDLSPEHDYETSFSLSGSLIGCHASVTAQGRTLVEYQVVEKKLQPIPKPADVLKAPQELKSLEDLYLAATHLEQYRHATYHPVDYYLEGLRRDATDIRLNDGYGLLLLNRGCIKESISHFETAIKKQCWKNPNPTSGECFYHLGLAYAADGKDDKAFDAFYKATWSKDSQDTGFYWLACLASRKGRYEEALQFAEKSLIRNWHNMKVRNVILALRRKLGLEFEALLTESLVIDPLYMGCIYEKALACSDKTDWIRSMRSEAHNYLILSLDYMNFGFYEDALNLLKACPKPNPMCLYYEGYAYHCSGDDAFALRCYQDAEVACPDYCNPNHREEIIILEHAISLLPQAPMANYYLGNLYYDKKQDQKAIACWESSLQEKSDFANTYRNLAIAYYNKQQDGQKALSFMKEACRIDPQYYRYWLEYDQLAERMNVRIQDRLATMESHRSIVLDHDNLLLRYITLLNCSGRHEDALSILKTHQFHPWEGGEGKVIGQYKYALIQIAKEKMKNQQPEVAITLLNSTLLYPHNLGEGKLPNVHDNEAYYYIGLAYEQMNDQKKASESFELAATGSTEPDVVLYYNDQPSDYIYYLGLAAQKIGQTGKALKAYHQLIIYGETHIFDTVDYDYFAVSLPEMEVFQDNLPLRNRVYCNYLRALGSLGLGDTKTARELTAQILDEQCEHQGALVIQKEL